MRILFSATPAPGHLFPLLPLAGAARDTGHEVALLTSGLMAGAVGDLPVLSAGPEPAVLAAEVTRRVGSDLDNLGAHNADMVDDPAPVVEFFVDTRIDLSLEEALTVAKGFRPDLIVCEALDFVGPMVAASLGVPWTRYEITVPRPEAFTRLAEARAAARYTQRGLTPTAPVVRVDPWPEAQADAPAATDDKITIRSQAYSPNGSAPLWSPPTFPGREDRPLVLLTLGTTVGTILAVETLEAALASVAAQDVNVVVTLGPGGDPDTFTTDRSRVHPVGFVPLGSLLEGVDLVVSVGGAGTVLGALSRGVPLVLMPMIAEQPLTAARVAAMGAAVVVDAPERLGAAVGEVLADPAYRAAAAGVAETMRAMNPPDEALRLVLDRVGRKSSTAPRPPG